MKLIGKTCLLVIGITLSATAYSANDPLKNAIKARQGEMQLHAFNVGPLFGMAKGKKTTMPRWRKNLPEISS